MLSTDRRITGNAEPAVCLSIPEATVRTRFFRARSLLRESLAKEVDYAISAVSVETLKTQADVLRFAAQLETDAVSAYLGAIPILDNRDLSRAAGSILGDEAMHWAVLRQALGEDPVPAAFVG